MGTPLGMPVDPEVNRKYAVSRGSLRYSNGVAAQLSQSFSDNAGMKCLQVTFAESIHPTAIDRVDPSPAHRASSKGAADPAARMQRGSAAATMCARRGPGLAGSRGT